MAINVKNQAAASNGKIAILVGIVGGQVMPIRYAPSSAGHWENYDELCTLFEKAKQKLAARVRA